MWRHREGTAVFRPRREAGADSSLKPPKEPTLPYLQPRCPTPELEKFLLSKPLSLWHFVPAALGN